MAQKPMSQRIMFGNVNLRVGGRRRMLVIGRPCYKQEKFANQYDYHLKAFKLSNTKLINIAIILQHPRFPT